MWFCLQTRQYRVGQLSGRVESSPRSDRQSKSFHSQINFWTVSNPRYFKDTQESAAETTTHHKRNSSLAFIWCLFLPWRLVGLTLSQIMPNTDMNVFLHVYFCVLKLPLNVTLRFKESLKPTWPQAVPVMAQAGHQEEFPHRMDN